MMRLKNNFNTRVIIFHLLCWGIFIAYEVFFIVFVYHIKYPFVNHLFFYSCNILLFYFHFYSLNKCLNGIRSRYILLGTFIFSEILVISSIKLSFDYLVLLKNTPPNKILEQLKVSAGLDFQRTVFYLYFSTVIWSAINFGRLRRRTTEALLRSAILDKTTTDLKYQFAQEQNAFLKEQINPHLLFNTLNAIYGTVYRHSPKDSEAVLLLSDIMRYSYQEPDINGLVQLESELLQLKNLINLNTYRFRDTNQLHFNIKGDAKNHRIIPLILLTLTENMFKHGDLQQKPRSLEITVKEDGQLRYVSNNVRRYVGSLESNSNVGLSNTKLRLDYAYPGNYKLDITQTEELFTLDLNINLAYERSNH